MFKVRNYLISIGVVLMSFFAAAMPVYADTKSERLSGSDRYGTANAICSYGWSGTSDYVVIATGEDYPDALSASVIASEYNAPILLTQKNDLGQDLVNRLKALSTKNAIIIGGTGVISTKVEQQLKNLGISIARYAGKDRYETSVKIAEQAGDAKGIFVTTGDDFSDALSVAPIAARMGMPLLLVSKNSMPDSVKAYLQGKNIENTYLVGGTDLVSDNVANQLPNVERISGTKYQKNIKLIDEFSSVLDFSTIYVATGNNYPDAISGSALAALTASPIVLADNNIADETKSFFKLNSENIKQINVLGGEGAVTPNTLNQVIGASGNSGFNLGTLNDSGYTNNFLGINIKIPNGWEAYKGTSTDKIDSEIAFLLTSYKVGAQGDESLSIEAVNVTGNPNATDENYAAYIKDHFSETYGNKFVPGSNISTEMIGGRTFHAFDAKFTYDDGSTINQRVYCSVHNGYGMIMFADYNDGQSLSDFTAMLNSISFTK